jgi:ligand-binding sensor domain-containing protein
MRKFLFFFIILLSGFGYSQEPGIRNYTSLDGLPTNEVFRSLLSSDGYMWFATDDGVCRFDGEDFKTFTIDDGLTENTILDLTEDQEGRIWFVGLSGQLSYFYEGKILPFERNDLILKSKINTMITIPGLLSPLSLHHIKMSFADGSSIEIKGNRLFHYHLNNGDSLFISTIHDNYLSYITKLNSDTIVFHTQFNTVTCSSKLAIPLQWIHHYSHYLYLEYEDRVIFFYGKKAISLFNDGRTIIKNLGVTAVSALKGVFGGIWIASNKNGLFFYDNIDFDGKPQFQMLKKQFITSIRYDQNNRGWVTTSYGGIFYVQSLYVSNYFSNTNRADNYFSKILALDDQHYLFFNRNNAVFMSSDFSKPMEKIIIPQLKKRLVYSAKLYDNKVYLAFTEGLLEVPLSFFLNPKHPNKGIHDYHYSSVKDFIFQDSSAWFGTSSGMMRVPLNQLSHTDYHYQQYYLFKGQRINKIISYPWVYPDSSYSYLLYQTLDKLVRLRYREKPSFNFQTSSYSDKHGSGVFNNDLIFREKDQTIFVATKGNGLQIILKDSLITLSEKDGLLSNTINVLCLPNDSLLILGTNKGINVLELKNTNKYPSIAKSYFITTADGLKGNEINDISYQNQHIIATTNMGVSFINLPPITKMKDRFPIYITDFIVNGKRMTHKAGECIYLKYNENNIQIIFNAIDLHDKKNINYYYRLLGIDNRWKKINKSSIIFPFLPPNSYTFDIKAQNNYHFISENIASVNFTINNIYYKTTWFKLLIFILLLIIISSFFYIYFSRRNEKLKNEKLLAEYNQQSLIRAIKPHFIFNALNSASSFLMTNRKREAISYINQIALLIRKVFEHATQNRISIAEEISFHQNYIQIEQQRVHPQFGYSIQADKEIMNHEIPAFMSQVFIENSIWHGFTKEKLKGRFISISYRKRDEYIECCITDNGVGREASSIEKAFIHASNDDRKKEHGIDVIQRRIASINEGHHIPRIVLTFEDVKDETDKALGTRVRIKYHQLIVTERETDSKTQNMEGSMT